MKTIGNIRITSRELINRLVRRNKIEKNDIRFIKGGTGTFPTKITTYTDPNDQRQKTKTTPYSKDDLFIIYEVELMPAIGAEVIGDTYRSHLPFKIIFNIYGDESDDELQYMIAQMSTFEFRNWLRKKGLSLESEPDYQILDGRENLEWWIRRRVELNMNTEQKINYSKDNLPYAEFDEIEENIEIINEEVI